MPDRDRKELPFDPRPSAYEAGHHLARQLPPREGPPPTGDLPMPRGLDHAALAGYFENHPFFEQGQTKRERRTIREMHVVGEDEYTLTETTVETEWFSFGRDIFMKGDGR